MRDMLFLIILMNRSLQISLIPIDTKLFGLQRPTPDTFQSKRGYQKQLHQCNKYKANQMCGHYAFFFFSAVSLPGWQLSQYFCARTGATAKDHRGSIVRLWRRCSSVQCGQSTVHQLNVCAVCPCSTTVPCGHQR